MRTKHEPPGPRVAYFVARNLRANPCPSTDPDARGILPRVEWKDYDIPGKFQRHKGRDATIVYSQSGTPSIRSQPRAGCRVCWLGRIARTLATRESFASGCRSRRKDEGTRRVATVTSQSGPVLSAGGRVEWKPVSYERVYRTLTAGEWTSFVAFNRKKRDLSCVVGLPIQEPRWPWRN